jgi:hypothetical protein
MKSDRFVIEPATPADADEILSILEENVFAGNISLIYTRRPDAYRSFMSEGDQVQLFACRDMQEGRVAGVAATALHECFIDHRPEKIVYLFGLRMSRRPPTGRVLLTLPDAYRQVIEQYHAQGVRYFITTILKDNLPAQRLLTKERAHMPTYTPLCPYFTLTFRTRRRAPSLPASCLFRKATREDRAAIEDFLAVDGGRCDFFPSHVGNLFGRHPELSWESFYLLTDRRQGNILACGAAWDQASYKQYIVAGYGGVLRWLYPASFLLPLFGYPALPKPSTLLRFFLLSFWCVKDNREEHLKWFLDSVACEARDYPYFVVGVPEAHPLAPALNRWKLLRYDSNIYLVGNHVTPEDLANLRKSLYLECGWL